VTRLHHAIQTAFDKTISLFDKTLLHNWYTVTTMTFTWTHQALATRLTFSLLVNNLLYIIPNLVLGSSACLVTAPTYLPLATTSGADQHCIIIVCVTNITYKFTKYSPNTIKKFHILSRSNKVEFNTYAGPSSQTSISTYKKTIYINN